MRKPKSPESPGIFLHRVIKLEAIKSDSNKIGSNKIWILFNWFNDFINDFNENFRTYFIATFGQSEMTFSN